jgi:hypothetical protein
MNYTLFTLPANHLRIDHTESRCTCPHPLQVDQADQVYQVPHSSAHRIERGQDDRSDTSLWDSTMGGSVGI